MKIIKIISNYLVLIDNGYNQGIRDDDEFEIYVKGNEITHPDSNESLGTLDYVKATLTVLYTLPNMTVCKNTNTYEENPYAFATIINQTITKTSKLKVDQEEIEGFGFKTDSTIKVGDLVRLKGYPKIDNYRL